MTTTATKTMWYILLYTLPLPLFLSLSHLSLSCTHMQLPATTATNEWQNTTRNFNPKMIDNHCRRRKSFITFRLLGVKSMQHYQHHHYYILTYHAHHRLGTGLGSGTSEAQAHCALLMFALNSTDNGQESCWAHFLLAFTSSVRHDSGAREREGEWDSTRKTLPAKAKI